MKAYSLDLRQRIVHAVEHGLSPQEVAEQFEVGLTTVKRFVHLAAAGELVPKTRPGRTRLLGPAAQAALWAQLEAHADATLAEHCALWETSQGVRVSVATMSRAIRRLGWTRKKRHWLPPSARRRPGLNGAATSRPPTRPSSSSSTRRVPTSP